MVFAYFFKKKLTFPSGPWLQQTRPKLVLNGNSCGQKPIKIFFRLRLFLDYFQKVATGCHNKFWTGLQQKNAQKNREILFTFYLSISPFNLTIFFTINSKF